MAKAKINIFEYATRNKLRFEYKGSITVEELWQLPVTELNEIFKEYNKQKKELSGEESLLEEDVNTVDLELVMIKIDIIKHIVDVKITEAKALEVSKIKAQQRQQIMQLIVDKENAELKNKSIKELEEMLASL